MPAALCPAGEFPATTTLPRYAAGREDMVAVLLLFCGQAGQFLELTSNANRSSTRLLQDYFGWHGMLVDEANYGQIVRRAPCADGKCTTLASLSKQLPNSRINLMSIDAAACRVAVLRRRFTGPRRSCPRPAAHQKARRFEDDP